VEAHDDELIALRGALAGELIAPGDPDYDAVRRPAVGRFAGSRPVAIARCATTGDVAAALATARALGVAVAVRSGGHCFAGRSSTDGLLIDVRPLAGIAVDDGIATVGAGARLGEIYDALEPRGMTIAAGCGPGVGIAGLALGGGLGLLGRMHGLTSDSLVGARVVLADGRVVDCDEFRDHELFWALRGAGGGNFGVVCELRLATVPAPRVTVFKLDWAGEHAARLLAAWQEWAPDGPPGLAASLLVAAGPDPAEPPVATLLGTLADGDAKLLAELPARAGAGADAELIRELGYREAKRLLAGLGEDDPSAQPYGASEFFREPLPAAAVAALVDHLAADRVAGQARVLDLMPWGGAYNAVPAEATAFPHRHERFLVKHSAVIGPDAGRAEHAAADRWVRRSWSIVHPHGAGGAYVNFPDPGLGDWERAYHGGNLERLARVKAAYDPDGVFAFPQSVPAYVP
jgi:FAD/FMN-containing dehydrogenase